jgi:sensor histidine kinase YesM
MSAFFSGICFSISPDNHFIRGPLGYTCAVVSFLLLAFLSWTVIRRYQKEGKFQAFSPAIFSLLIIVASVLDMTLWRRAQIELLPFVITTVSLFQYIWLHLRFVWEHEEALKAEQRIRIMISQIQPHFLFNTLTTIQTLCDIDPPKAEETVGKFAAYLRQNIQSLDRSDLVPFEKEMEHTRIYADIEMIRFPDIRVEYDTQDTAFSLPALTVQPLVENAIRHGVRGLDNGLVSVSSRDRGAFHEIVVADNGKGFDASAISSMESAHVGLRNVRDRIVSLCGGAMDVVSEAGKGTTITIRIPKGGPQA